MDAFKIIQEDDDILVCYKPAGIATQTRRLGEKDMESLLRNYRAGKGEPPYIGIVHRLDQPVEGIMVFAKNQKAAAALSKQVQKRSIGKHYYALVHTDGTLPKKGTLTDYLLFDPKQNCTTVVEGTPVTGSTRKTQDGKNKGWNHSSRNGGSQNPQKAVLDYEIRQEQDGIALLDITLHTGRHHQIRVQLAHAGCPILGDTKYGNAQDGTSQSGEPQNGRECPQSGESHQLALCSYRLSFLHPTTGAKVDLRIRPENPKFSLFI
jgi:23S rRNA pseudouridine1911/1915/1917 synthase